MVGVTSVLLLLVSAGSVYTTEVAPLVVILLDGFRWDYVDQQDRAALPGFNKFIRNGVKARWLQPVYPTNSFPNWHAISTGRYPESSGIFNNYYFNRSSSLEFSLQFLETTKNSVWWQQSEPIWTTATRQGRRSAVYHWSRPDVAVNGILPEVYTPYQDDNDKEFSFWMEDKVIQHLKDGFKLIQVHNTEVDTAGHFSGPNSPEVKESVRKMDQILVSFMHKLEDNDLMDKVNIVILSDHGMTPMEKTSVTEISLENYISEDDFEKVVDGVSSMGFYVSSERIEEVYQRLSAIPEETCKVYMKEDIPAFLNISRHPLCPDIFLKPNTGYSLRGFDAHVKHIPSYNFSMYKGYHGYDAFTPNMRAIFMAKGPDFKKGYLSSPIMMVDVYQIMTHLLQITPEAHNGTWSHVADMLATETHSTFSTLIYALIIILALLIVFIYRKNNKRKTDSYDLQGQKLIKRA